MSLIMHVFGLAHFDAHILPLLVSTGERHKQTTHIVATITQTMTRFLGTFPSSFRNQYPNANTEFLPGCHRQNVAFSSSQVYVCLCKFLQNWKGHCLHHTLHVQRGGGRGAVHAFTEKGQTTAFDCHSHRERVWHCASQQVLENRGTHDRPIELYCLFASCAPSGKIICESVVVFLKLPVVHTRAKSCCVGATLLVVICHGHRRVSGSTCGHPRLF